MISPNTPGPQSSQLPGAPSTHTGASWPRDETTAAGAASSRDVVGDAGETQVGPGASEPAPPGATTSVDDGPSGPAPDAVRCGDPSLLLCEDFELTTPGGIPAGWTAEGDVEVTEQPHWGAHALRSNAQPNWVRRITRDASNLPAQHWGRVFYRVQLPVTASFVHSTFVAFQGDGPTVGRAEFRVVDTVKAESDAQGKHTHQFLWNVQPEQSVEYGLGSDYEFTFDGEWHCAEWFVSGVTQSYRFFFDARPVDPLDFTNGAGNFGTGQTKSDIPAEWRSVSIGFTNYQTADPGFTSWVDDFALATERIGCQ